MIIATELPGRMLLICPRAPL